MPSLTSLTLCDPINRSDPRTAVLASPSLLTLSAFIQHGVAYPVQSLPCLWLTWCATLQPGHMKAVNFLPSSWLLNEANSDFFAPCLWYKKIFDYILSEEKLWFYVCQRRCSRVRKYSDLYVRAPLKSTCEGSLQFIRNGHLLWKIINIAPSSMFPVGGTLWW